MASRRQTNAIKDPRIWMIFLPGFLFVVLFTFYPMGKMLVMSFFDWNIGFNQTSPYVGLDNYVRVLSDPIARIAMTNTFAYALITVPMQMVLGLCVALLIHGISRFSVFYRVGYYLPVITSWVVVALLFRYIFSNAGLLNYVLTDILSITDSHIGWLSSRWSALFAAMLLGIWKGIGWNMVIFLAALQAVPKTLYEAAEVDGANRRQQFRHITVPGIRGTVMFVSVMLMIGAFNTYTPITVLTNGNPAHQTEVVLTWMYFKTFDALDMGYAAALSMVITAVIVFFTVLIFYVLRRGRDGA